MEIVMSGFTPDELKYDWEQEESADFNQQTAANDLSIHKLQDGTLAVEKAHNKKPGLENPSPELSIKYGAGEMDIGYKKQLRKEEVKNKNTSGKRDVEEEKLNDNEELLPSMLSLFVQAVESGKDDSFSEAELHKISEYVDKHPDKLSDEQILILAGTNIDKMIDKKKESNDKTAGASASIRSGEPESSPHTQHADVRITPVADTDAPRREINVTPMPMPVKSLPTPKPPGF